MPSSLAEVPLPWSKKHKKVTKASTGGLSHSLSNSFAQPLDSKELLDLTRRREDSHDLVDEYFGHSLRYTPNGGSDDLRTEIAKHYEHPGVSSSNVLVFPGAQVALPSATSAIVGNGSGHAITFRPGYQSVTEGPAHVGGRVTTLTLSAANGWRIDVAAVAEAIRPDTRLIVINEPYNPAGTLMRRETQAKLIDLARTNGIYVLCDEVYRMLEHDPTDRLPAMADAYERGISVVTLSKPWGACGVSIGWVASQDVALMDKISDVQYFGTACPSRASELQAIMVLRSSDWILKRNMRIIRRNVALLEAFMETHKDLFEWVPPRAGAIAAIKFKGPLTSAELGAELAEEGISIKPAYCFTDVVTEENDYFRVGFGEEIMPNALEALDIFVKKRKAGWKSATQEVSTC